MKRLLITLFFQLFFLKSLLFAQSEVNFNYTIPPNADWLSCDQYDIGYNTSQSNYYLFNYVTNPSAICKSEYFGVNGLHPCNDKVCLKRAFLDQWKKIPGDVIRFPGGSNSQLYHSGLGAYNQNNFCPNYCAGDNHPNNSNGLFCGYGIKNQYYHPNNCQNCEYIHNGYIDFSNQLFGLNPLAKDDDRDHPRNILYDCIELIKEKEKADAIPESEYFPKTKVLYVVNLLTHFYAGDGSILANPTNPSNISTPAFQTKLNENLNGIRALLDNGIEITGIEMGNELNLGQAHAFNISVVDYVNLVKYYVDLIRTDSRPVMRDLKIGVNCQLDYAPENVGYDCNYNINLDEISTQTIEPDFSPNDFKIFNCCWNKYLRTCLDNTAFWSNGKPLFDAFIFHGYPVVENGDFKLATSQVFNKINDFTQTYNTGYTTATARNYWFTEWNQQNDLNSFLNAAFILDFNTQLVIYNAQHPNTSNVEFSTFHNLLGGGYSIFSQFSSTFEPNNSFAAFSLMRELRVLSNLPNSNNSTYNAMAPINNISFNTINGDSKEVMLKIFKRKIFNDYYKIPSNICSPLNSDGYFILFVNNGIIPKILNANVFFEGNNLGLQSFLPNISYFKYNSVTGKFDYSQVYLQIGNYELPPMSMGLISCYNTINQKVIAKSNEFLQLIEYNSIKLFPNPSNKQTNLIFNAKLAGMLNLELSDITGRVIMIKTIDAEKGINNQSIDLSGKSAGTYFVTLSVKGFKQTLKLIVY